MVNRVTLFLYWGGCVISNEEGFGYDRSNERVIVVDRNITYEGLLDNLNGRDYIKQLGRVAKMRCLYPVSVPPSPLKYTCLDVDCDETVEVMMNLMDLNRFSCIHLILDMESPFCSQTLLDQSVPTISSMSSVLTQFPGSMVPLSTPVLPPIDDVGLDTRITSVGEDYLPCGRDVNLVWNGSLNDDDDIDLNDSRVLDEDEDEDVGDAEDLGRQDGDDCYEPMSAWREVGDICRSAAAQTVGIDVMQADRVVSSQQAASSSGGPATVTLHRPRRRMRGRASRSQVMDAVVESLVDEPDCDITTSTGPPPPPTTTSTTPPPIAPIAPPPPTPPPPPPPPPPSPHPPTATSTPTPPPSPHPPTATSTPTPLATTITHVEGTSGSPTFDLGIDFSQTTENVSQVTQQTQDVLPPRGTPPVKKVYKKRRQREEDVPVLLGKRVPKPRKCGT